MKLFEDFYNFNEKKDKKEMLKGIKDIISLYTLDYIFDYKITNFIVDIVDLYKRVDVTIFGYGRPSLDSEHKKQDALIKLIFVKGKLLWSCKYKKSKVYKKIQRRDTEIKTENLFDIRNKILDFLNKKNK